MKVKSNRPVSIKMFVYPHDTFPVHMFEFLNLKNHNIYLYILPQGKTGTSRLINLASNKYKS